MTLKFIGIGLSALLAGCASLNDVVIVTLKDDIELLNVLNTALDAESNEGQLENLSDGPGTFHYNGFQCVYVTESEKTFWRTESKRKTTIECHKINKQSYEG